MPAAETESIRPPYRERTALAGYLVTPRFLLVRKAVKTSHDPVTSRNTKME
ncbi:hypothetical protein TCARB_0607 [Thermofilum adornatum 1505]|uniref:Uncharacterized protein n=1 Tax=Thermofilum adornatum 1505 TaxID=697581 RepID=A0A3G1A6B4_9CREN|nr:hypothetical protein TCARB_0607 [Thermofilum adornatum 1505]